MRAGAAGEHSAESNAFSTEYELRMKKQVTSLIDRLFLTL